jgi:hypothetical protein
LAWLRQWKSDAALASLRELDEMPNLPDDWASFKAHWADLDAALMRAP